MPEDYLSNYSPQVADWNYNTETMSAPPEMYGLGNLAQYWNDGGLENLGWEGNTFSSNVTGSPFFLA